MIHKEALMYIVTLITDSTTNFMAINSHMYERLLNVCYLHDIHLCGDQFLIILNVNFH